MRIIIHSTTSIYTFLRVNWIWNKWWWSNAKLINSKFNAICTVWLLLFWGLFYSPEKNKEKSSREVELEWERKKWIEGVFLCVKSLWWMLCAIFTAIVLIALGDWQSGNWENINGFFCVASVIFFSNNPKVVSG